MIDLPSKLLWADGELGDRQQQTFQAYERERRARQQRSGKGRPLGLRLSTACPVRMVKAVFEPGWYATPIDIGDAERGHELESRFRAIALLDVPHVYQPRVDWGVGVSAFDFQLNGEGEILELKTKAGRAYMQSDYRITTTRRMVAAGFTPGSQVQVVVVSPGNYDVTAGEALMVTLDDVAHAQHSKILAGVREAYASLQVMKDPAASDDYSTPEWWAAFNLVCACGWCEPLAKSDASPAIERLIVRYDLHLRAFQKATEDATRVLGLKVKSREWAEDKLHRQILEAAEFHAQRAEAPEGEPFRIQCWAADYDLCRNRAGNWQIKARKAMAVREAA
jgi:hypothetical protein